MATSALQSRSAPEFYAPLSPRLRGGWSTPASASPCRGPGLLTNRRRQKPSLPGCVGCRPRFSICCPRPAEGYGPDLYLYFPRFGVVEYIADRVAVMYVGIGCGTGSTRGNSTTIPSIPTPKPCFHSRARSPGALPAQYHKKATCKDPSQPAHCCFHPAVSTPKIAVPKRLPCATSARGTLWPATLPKLSLAFWHWRHCSYCLIRAI